MTRLPCRERISHWTYLKQKTATKTQRKGNWKCTTARDDKKGNSSQRGSSPRQDRTVHLEIQFLSCFGFFCSSTLDLFHLSLLLWAGVSFFLFPRRQHPSCPLLRDKCSYLIISLRSGRGPFIQSVTFRETSVFSRGTALLVHWCIQQNTKLTAARYSKMDMGGYNETGGGFWTG